MLTNADFRAMGEAFAVIQKQGHNQAAADFFKYVESKAESTGAKASYMDVFSKAAVAKFQSLDGMMWSDRLGFVSIPED